MIENKLTAEVLGLGWTFSWMDQKSKNEERICQYNKNLKPTCFYHEKKNENFTVTKGKPDKHY